MLLLGSKLGIVNDASPRDDTIRNLESGCVPSGRVVSKVALFHSALCSFEGADRRKKGTREE